MADPAKAPLFQHLKDSDGRWAVRDDVWVRYKRENGPLLSGPLTVGFSVYGDRHHFGPELQFGHVLGDYFDNQVVLIKTAWGGKSLFQDFRPPSSGGTTGPYYTRHAHLPLRGGFDRIIATPAEFINGQSETTAVIHDVCPTFRVAAFTIDRRNYERLKPIRALAGSAKSRVWSHQCLPNSLAACPPFPA